MLDPALGVPDAVLSLVEVRFVFWFVSFETPGGAMTAVYKCCVEVLHTSVVYKCFM